jgi:hypothetical protein
LTKRRRQLEDMVARIQAIAIEHPRARLTRALSGLAGQLGILQRRLPYRRRYRRLVWPRLLRILRSVLIYRYLPVLLAIFGVALTMPSIWHGWGTLDDVLQRKVLLSATFSTAVADQFRFLHPSVNAELMDLGVIPWWSLPQARISFFRPLSTLTHWLDYQLWPDSPLLMHVHCLLWYGCLCALAAAFYRRFLGRVPVAGLVAFLFSGSLNHLNFLGTISGRNVVLAGVFGLLTLVFHDRWRRDEWRTSSVLAVLSMVLALLSAEAGVATIAYLTAYAVFLDRGTWRCRLGTLVPYVSVIVVWRLSYQYLGYGAWGSGFYVDPGREPLRFATAVAENGPMLLFGKWTYLEPGLYGFFAGWSSLLMWLVAVSFMVFVGWILLPLLKQDRVARFWAMGMVLAVIPSCAVSLPTGRLLLFVEFGALGLVAQFIGGVVERADWLPARRGWHAPARLLVLFLLGMHAFVSPALTPALNGAHDSMAWVAELGSLEGVEQQDVVIVNAPSPGQFIYARNLRALRGQAVPAHLRLLAPGYEAVDITRVDEHTVLVRPAYGYSAPPGARAVSRMNPLNPVHAAYGYRHGDLLFRSATSEIVTGQQVVLTGMRVEITALHDDGRPAEACVRFSVPLEDPSLRWLQWDWKGGRYVPFAIPAVGETVHVSGPF